MDEISYWSPHILWDRGIKLDTATLISFSTLIFERYLESSQQAPKPQIRTNEKMVLIKQTALAFYHSLYNNIRLQLQ